MSDRERLLDELRPVAVAIAYRMLGSVSEAEDVVQEALLRVHQALDGASRSLLNNGQVPDDSKERPASRRPRHCRCLSPARRQHGYRTRTCHFETPALAFRRASR